LHDRIENLKQIQIDFSNLDVFARRLPAFFRLPRLGFQAATGLAPHQYFSDFRRNLLDIRKIIKDIG